MPLTDSLWPYHIHPSQATPTRATCRGVMIMGHLAISSVFSKSLRSSSFLRKISSSCAISPHQELWLSIIDLRVLITVCGSYQKDGVSFFHITSSEGYVWGHILAASSTPWNRLLQQGGHNPSSHSALRCVLFILVSFLTLLWLGFFWFWELSPTIPIW